MTPFEELIQETGVSDLLDRIRILLVYAAEGGVMAREHSVIYADLRSRLLGSSAGKLLPGFMYQCVTLARFSDFISLYDPDIILRVSFIDRMIERCRDMQAPADPFDVDEHRFFEDGRR